MVIAYLAKKEKKNQEHKKRMKYYDKQIRKSNRISINENEFKTQLLVY